VHFAIVSPYLISQMSQLAVHGTHALFVSSNVNLLLHENL